MLVFFYLSVFQYRETIGHVSILAERLVGEGGGMEENLEIHGVSSVPPL